MSAVYCPLCEAHCGLEVEMDGRRAIAVQGDKSDPDSRGYVCPKGTALAEIHNHPHRLHDPLIRGPGGRFRKASWNEALGVVAEKLDSVRDRHGPQAMGIHVGRAGIDEDFIDFARLFCYLFGSPNFSHAGSHCSMSRRMANLLTAGASFVPDYRNSDCILLWGFNPSASCPALARLIRNRHSEGAKLIVVDPYRTPLAEIADLHLQLRPGSDGALALGMLQVLFQEQLVDQQFAEDWVLGLDELREAVAVYSPERVEELTWVPASILKAAAWLYAGDPKSCLAMGLAPELQPGGLQALRAIALLQAITGKLDVAGGGLLAARSPLAGLGASKVKPGVEAIGARDYPLFVQLTDSAQGDLFPRAALAGDPYPLRALISTCGNPPLTWPGSRRVMESLRALDLIVAIDLFETACTRVADVVLPASSPLERWHLYDRFQFAGDARLVVSAPLTDPVGSLSDWEIFHRLAMAAGLGGAWAWTDEEAALDHRLSRLGTTAREAAAVPAGIRYRDTTYKTYGTGGQAGGFRTPSGKVEAFSQRMADAGYDPLPVFIEPTESPFSRPDLIADYPLILTTGARSIGYMSSRGRNIPSLRRLAPDPVVDVHPDTAARMGLLDGALARIVTPRGSVTVSVSITDGVDPRVIRAPHGWEEANINEVTDYATSACDPVSGFPPWRALLARVERV